MEHVFLDYSVLDQLLRVRTGRYNGDHTTALLELEQIAMAGRVRVWISEITLAEQAHGVQNPKLSDAKRARAEGNDRAKLQIAEGMQAGYLTYPASKTDDEYSLLEATFRCAGPDTKVAIELESKLRQVAGVSPGDASQLVSCMFGVDTRDLATRPPIERFVAEDGRLLQGICTARQQGEIHELHALRVMSVAELTAQLSGRPPK